MSVNTTGYQLNPVTVAVFAGCLVFPLKSGYELENPMANPKESGKQSELSNSKRKALKLR
jgi:hypothetical protein